MCKKPKRKDYPKIYVKFEGKLRDYQEEVKDESIERLNKCGTSLIAMYTGGGKTIIAIYIASLISMKNFNYHKKYSAY